MATMWLVVVSVLASIAQCKRGKKHHHHHHQSLSRSDLSSTRFEQFKAEVVEMVSCNDIFRADCAGLTFDHPKVTQYDTDGLPFVLKPIVAGLVRLSFHDCGGIDPRKVRSGNTKFFSNPKKNGRAGGCNGCIGLENPSHDLLWDAAIEFIQPICEEYESDMSRADCWALAATIAIEQAAADLSATTPFGQTIEPSLFEGDIPYYVGRSDCANGYPESDVDFVFSNPEGVSFEFPDAMLGWTHLDQFLKSRFGWNNDDDYFTNRDVVALISGAHSLGRAHGQISGFSGGWDFTPQTLDNHFISKLFGEDFAALSFETVQNLNQSTRNPAVEGAKPQWQIRQSPVAFERFPQLLTMDPPLLSVTMMLNTDLSMVYDLSYWIENGMQDHIDCNTNAKALCPAGKVIITAPRGYSSNFNKRRGYSGSREDLGEQYVCNEGEDCCQYVQCPIQCEGGIKEFDRLVEFDLIDGLDDTSKCPAGLAYKYSMHTSSVNIERNQMMGAGFAKAFIKMITIGYVDKKSGQVLLSVVPGTGSDAAGAHGKDYSNSNISSINDASISSWMMSLVLVAPVQFALILS